MNNEIAIKVENLSKLYRLGEIGTGTISHDLNRFFAKVRGKEDPYSIVGQTNDRTTQAQSDYVWALKDINFEVKKGEVLGIIGKNGAGKSTLLKLISQITSPTEGSIKARGRIASLLEVGTGMHPEMTARENIYLNGAILGMRKHEIKGKFDEIIDFAGCQLYVDTPLKRFSSGMRVRLGFAVAAFLEPEILIVDEVLAVGDAEFQKKAIGKMKDVSKGEGRTVLFVSHNMASVKSLCSRGIILENGKLSYNGNVDEAVDLYMKEGSVGGNTNVKIWKDLNKAPGSKGVKITSFKIQANNKSENEPIFMDEELLITCTLEIDDPSRDINATFQFKDENGYYLFVSGSGSGLAKESISTHSLKLTCVVPSHLFNQGTFFINCVITEDKRKALFSIDDIVCYIINSSKNELGKWMGKTKGALKPSLIWKKEFI